LATLVSPLPTPLPAYLVAEMARRHVTMALSGDGGDEVFGGYASYRYHASAAGNRSLPAPLHAGIRARGFPPDRGLQISESSDHFGTWESPEAVLNCVDYETYLPGDILVKVDRMSMANSLEKRSPLLEFRLAEFAASLPRGYKWSPWAGKRILKRAAASVLPASILRRPKQGFASPLGSWFRGELQPFVCDVIRSTPAGHAVPPDYCEALLERHQAGPGGGTERKLWSILCYLPAMRNSVPSPVTAALIDYGEAGLSWS
jgi:asparagine synthase (glutamine-hydrolysing)